MYSRRAMHALADLHRHLDGSLREATLRELATARGVAIPEPLAFHAGMGLTAALERFGVTVAVLQDPAALHRVASEACEDAARSGVTTLELRFAPQLHGDIGRALDAVLDGVAGRAGVLVCALYGEPPEQVEQLVRLAAARSGVVGVDIAGAPSSGAAWRIGDYAAAFRLAAELGLGRTVHAGEGRPPDEIRIAIEELGAQRIGHGTTLLDDRAVLDLVLERGITIEACPTSNLHTGVIGRLDQHPIVRWAALGVQVCVCTDNTLFSGVDAAEEHARVRGLPGMTDAVFAEIVARGHAAAFPRR
jgi:adenosine deaminase